MGDIIHFPRIQPQRTRIAAAGIVLILPVIRIEREGEVSQTWVPIAERSHTGAYLRQAEEGL